MVTHFSTQSVANFTKLTVPLISTLIGRLLASIDCGIYVGGVMGHELAVHVDLAK